MTMRSPQQEARAAAEAVTPFIAEHYYTTGQDVADVAAADRDLLCLATLYAELPSVVDEAVRRAAQERDPDALAHHQALAREANVLLDDTARAIRGRLAALGRGVSATERAD